MNQVRLSLVHAEGSSSDPIACGMSGTAPTPYQAILNLPYCGMLRLAQSPAGELPPALSLLRKTRISSELRGSIGRISVRHCRGVVSPAYALGKLPRVQVEPVGTFEQMQPPQLSGRLRSRSICYAARDLTQYETHTPDRHVRRKQNDEAETSTNVLCTDKNNTFCGGETPASRPHIARNKDSQSRGHRVTYYSSLQ